MTYKIVRTKRFKRAYKRVRQLPGFKSDVFEDVVTTLANGKALGKTFRDHALTGRLKDFRECHLSPDILLIYQHNGKELILILVGIGSHAQLFK